jgi:hypothetical protein
VVVLPGVDVARDEAVDRDVGDRRSVPIEELPHPLVAVERG